MRKWSERTNDLILVSLAQNNRVGDMPTNLKILFHTELILTRPEEMLHVFNGFLEHIHKPDYHGVILANG